MICTSHLKYPRLGACVCAEGKKNKDSRVRGVGCLGEVGGRFLKSEQEAESLAIPNKITDLDGRTNDIRLLIKLIFLSKLLVIAKVCHQVIFPSTEHIL